MDHYDDHRAESPKKEEDWSHFQLTYLENFGMLKNSLQDELKELKFRNKKSKTIL